MAEKTSKITRKYLRYRYGLAMCIIIATAITSAIISLSVSQSYQTVTKDVQNITKLSSQATDSINKIHQLLSLDIDERNNYSASARIAINMMAATLADLKASTTAAKALHLEAMKNDLIGGAHVFDKMVEYGRKIINTAEVGAETQTDVLRFVNLTTTQFSQIISRLSSHAAEEQQRLSQLSLYASIVASSTLTLMVVLIIVFVFLPMETRIVTTNEALEREKQKVQAAKELTEYQARHDALTGLANLRVLSEAIQSRQQLPEHVHTLIRIDLDFFKQVNDTFGHDAGDFVLKNVAEILRDGTRSGDLVLRVGGDEFIIFLRANASAVEAKAICERLLSKIQISLTYEGHDLGVGASFGIASTATKNVTLDNLIKVADDALYQAKADGRNCVRVFSHAVQNKRIDQEKQAA